MSAEYGAKASALIAAVLIIHCSVQRYKKNI